nr:hypothetical protein [Kiritimatiellia bacterium]
MKTTNMLGGLCNSWRSALPNDLKVIAALALSAAAMLPIAAEAVNFPDADGSHDIASSTAWGGALPTTETEVAITGKTQTVTANSDVMLSSALLKNGLTTDYNYTLTFDMTEQPDRKLYFRGFNQGGAKVRTAFKGGYWDLGGRYFCNAGNTTGAYGNNKFVTISDGAVITNTAACSLAYTANQKNLRLSLSGQSQLHIGGVFNFAQTETGSPSTNIVEVTDGSVMTVAGKFQWDNPSVSWGNAVDYRDYVIVDGEGSSLKLLSSDIARFKMKGGGAMIIRNNGALSAKTLVMGWKYTRNNLLRVESGASASADSIYMSGYYGAAGNTYMSSPDAAVDGLRNKRVEVLNGGTLQVSGTFCMAYGESQSGNTLVVSNGTFKASIFALAQANGAGTSTNQCVYIQGPDAVFDIPAVNGNAMFTCSHSEWNVELGAKFMPSATFSYTTDRLHDNVLRVASGASLTNVAITTSKMTTGTSIATWNNRLVAESGAVVTGQYVYVVGSNCVFRVDDAMVWLTEHSGSHVAIGIGRSWQTSGEILGGASTNCSLIVAGTNPKITLGGDLEVKQGSRILFELPTNGFADNSPRISTTGAVTMDDGCTIEFTGAEAMLAGLQHNHVNAEYVLIENPSENVFVSDDVVAAAQV